MLAYRRPKSGYLSRLEVMVVEAAATTVGALRFMGEQGPKACLMGAASAALLVVAVMEVVRLRSTPVELWQAPPTAFDRIGAAVRRQTEENGGGDEARTLRSILLVAMFSPVIAAFVIAQMVVLYAIPVIVTILFAAVYEASWSAAGLTVGLGIGAGIVNELVVILPARNHLSWT